MFCSSDSFTGNEKFCKFTHVGQTPKVNKGIKPTQLPGSWGTQILTARGCLEDKAFLAQAWGGDPGHSAAPESLTPTHSQATEPPYPGGTTPTPQNLSTLTFRARCILIIQLHLPVGIQLFKMH